MRYNFGLSSPTPNVTRFLIIIIAMYLGFALFGRNLIGFEIYNALVLNPHQVIKSFELWRLLSYGFLHDASSPMHVIFNAFMLYSIGPDLENRWGEKKFLSFIIIAILLGGCLVCLGYILGLSHASVVGFSAATMGLLIAWGLTNSHSTIYFFGLLPLTGIQLVYVTVGLEIVYAVSATSISSAAHFGGMLAGLIFTEDLYRPHRIYNLWRRLKNKQRSRRY